MRGLEIRWKQNLEKRRLEEQQALLALQEERKELRGGKEGGMEAYGSQWNPMASLHLQKRDSLSCPFFVEKTLPSLQFIGCQKSIEERG